MSNAIDYGALRRDKYQFRAKSESLIELSEHGHVIEMHFSS